jgi:hypothetical protein
LVILVATSAAIALGRLPKEADEHASPERDATFGQVLVRSPFQSVNGTVAKLPPRMKCDSCRTLSYA